MKDEIAYQNKWYRIVFRGTLIVLKSKTDKYYEKYFLTVTAAKKYIGVNE